MNGQEGNPSSKKIDLSGQVPPFPSAVLHTFSKMVPRPVPSPASTS